MVDGHIIVNFNFYHRQRSTVNRQLFTSSLFSRPEFYPAAPYHGTCSSIHRSNGCNLADGQLTDNGYAIEPGTHSLEEDPVPGSCLLLSALRAGQHILQPLLPVSFVWL